MLRQLTKPLAMRWTGPIRLFSTDLVDFLSQKLRLPENLSQQQRQRLFDAIVQNLKPIYGPKIDVSHLETFASGLQPLAESILQSNGSILSEGPATTVRVHLPRNNGSTAIPWSYQHQTLLQAIQASENTSEFIEASCTGNASCCTCHVYVETNNVQLPTIAEEEQDMLDYAIDLRTTSRLACQVKLEGSLGKDSTVEVTLPDEVNNLWK